MLGEQLGKKFLECFTDEFGGLDDSDPLKGYLKRMANIACADLAAVGRPTGLIDIRGSVEKKSETAGKDIVLTISVLNTHENRMALVDLSGPVTVTGLQMEMLKTGEAPVEGDPNQTTLDDLPLLDDLPPEEGEESEEQENEEEDAEE